MKFAGWYWVAVGILMIAMWTTFFTVLGVPELETEPWAIGLHVVAELATAVALLVGGAGILAGRPWGPAAYSVAIGMLFYTVINSPATSRSKGSGHSSGCLGRCSFSRSSV